jgi:branched-subunit amino acid aminotransferase/4-amino-4-deoxychorismate lyase
VSQTQSRESRCCSRVAFSDNEDGSAFTRGEVDVVISAADSLAWCNGHWVPAESIRLSLSDPGIATGALITDMCRTYRGRLFEHPRHVARFLRDAAACFIPLSVTEAQLRDLAQEVLRRNGVEKANGREVVLNTLATPQTLILRLLPLDENRHRLWREQGVPLWLTPPHPPSQLLPPTIKHRNRLAWHIAAQLAPAGSLALTTDEEGHVLETALGNLLLVLEGAVWAARPGTVLDSISQQVVRECCLARGIAWHEADRTAEADEALLCGTAFGLVGVAAIGTRHYPCPGPLTRQLLSDWERLTLDGETEASGQVQSTRATGAF